MAGISAALLAVVFTCIEMHYAAKWAWLGRRLWAWVVVAVDGAVAYGACQGALRWDDALSDHGIGASAWTIALLVGTLGPRILYLVPVPFAAAGSARFVNLRQYAVTQVAVSAEVARASLIVDKFEPCAKRLTDLQLDRYTAAVLRQAIASGRIASDETAMEIVQRTRRDAATLDDTIVALVELIWTWGGRAACDELVRRSRRQVAAESRSLRQKPFTGSTRPFAARLAPVGRKRLRLPKQPPAAFKGDGDD